MIPNAALEEFEAEHRSPQGTGDEDPIARPRAMSTDRLVPRDVSRHCHVDEYPFRRGRVAPGKSHAEPTAGCVDAVEKQVDPGGIQVVGDGQRQEEVRGLRAHGANVADVSRDGLEPDRVRRMERSAEMGVFDKQVGA